MAASQQARDILSHLLSELDDPSSRWNARYGDWVQRHGKQELEEFLFGCLRPEVLTYLRLGNGQINSLKNIGGDITYEGRGIYLHGILGLDRRTRIYIGQSNHLRTRLKKHWNFRYRRDNPSLHYHAMQNSVFDIFTTLAILPYSSPNSQRHPGMDRPDLVLNFLEAWCCLLFRCLPPTLLRQYLPEHVDAVKEGKEANQALNVANPLDNGETENPREFVDLYESEDPLVLEYLHELERKRRPEPPTVVIQQPAIPPEVLEPPGLAQRLGLTPATLVLIGAVAVMGIVLVKRGPASVGRPR